MLTYLVSMVKVNVVFLVVLLAFLSSSWAQNDDKEEVNVENIMRLELGEESTGVESEVVQTTGGPVIGSTEKSPDGVQVSVYYGIPYAAAPIGPLRFRPPVRVSSWKTPLVAKKPIPMCYQEFKPVKGMELAQKYLSRPWTEACLTVSVWAPKPKSQGLPVLVNIHGGAFVAGSPVILTDGTVMASKGVLVVSLSYRLGVFGFFTLGYSDAPGNVGLMDQTLALQWVQVNAAAFGGDPSRVTLIGISAGGASVGYHLLSPMSKGLFSAAIVMGGAPTNPWAIKEPERAIQKSNTLLASLGCSNSNLSLSLDCIQSRNADDIVELSTNRDMITSENFIPSVDGQFITDHPEVYIEAGRIASAVPLIIGTSEHEGSVFLLFKLQNQNGNVFRWEFHDLIGKMDQALTPQELKALDVLYTNWSNPDDPTLLRDALRDLYGDHLIVCGANKLTDGLAKVGSNVYRYVFGHPMGMGFMTLPSWLGATHGSEFRPIFGPEVAGGTNKEDVIVTEEFRRRILNFLKTRNPNDNSDGTAEEVLWPQYNLRDRSYLHFAVNTRVKTAPRIRECRVLEELLPALASVNKDC